MAMVVAMAASCTKGVHCFLHILSTIFPLCLPLFPDVLRLVTKFIVLCFGLCFASDQDESLEALSTVISRQKQMGQMIGTELDEHNGKMLINSPVFYFCHVFLLTVACTLYRYV